MNYLIVFFILISSLILLKPENKIQEPKIYNPFENAVETKVKYFYDSNDIMKTPLAAMNVVTKYNTKKWLSKRVEIASKEDIDTWNLDFSIPLKLKNGDLIFTTQQLVYYLE